MQYRTVKDVLSAIQYKRGIAFLNPNIACDSYADQKENDIPELDGLYDYCEIRNDGTRFYYIALGSGNKKRKFTNLEIVGFFGAALMKAKLIQQNITGKEYSAFVIIALAFDPFMDGLAKLVLDYIDQSKICLIVWQPGSPTDNWRGKMAYHPNEFALEWFKKQSNRPTEPNQSLQTMTIADTSAAAHPPRQL